MPETVVPHRPVTQAVIDALSLAVGFAVGDGQAPDDPSPAYPYLVVYSLADADRSGPISDGQADVTHNIQITTVGQTPEQATSLMDLAAVGLRGLDAGAVTGREIQLVEETFSGGVERDDDFQPPLFYAVSIFDIMTTPA